MEFKGSSVDSAIEKGLKKLGLTIEQVEVEVVSEGNGLFGKATVKITPLENIEEPVEENKEETVDEIVETDVEEKEEKEEAHGEKKERRDRRDNRRQPRERKEYFAEEKKMGKEYIATIASYFSDKARIDAKSYEDEICFYIGGDDAKLFIGHRGETLDAIQYLASQYINSRRGDEHIRVTVDADFYRERRKRILTALAKKMATQAYEQRKEIALEPMNSYERRIIHSALQNSDEATTRSEGEGKDRHVVIVPKCEIMTYGNVNSEFRKKGPGRTKTYGGKKVIF